MLKKVKNKKMKVNIFYLCMIFMTLASCASDIDDQKSQTYTQDSLWLSSYKSRDTLNETLRLVLLESEFQTVKEYISKSCGCNCPNPDSIIEYQKETNQMLQDNIDGKLPPFGFQNRLKQLESKAQELRCGDNPTEVKKFYIERLQSIMKLKPHLKSIKTEMKKYQIT